ncbi:integrase [Pseudomonas sp. WS 5011]|nr:integrase [Pseudomonas sp. Leaf83]KSJ04462.1 integrase [Pseudomonas aeruginosa]NMY51692.1 integrase [Pseudomonas sp. WS 5011]
MVAHLKLVSFNPNPLLSPTTNLRNFVRYCQNELTLWQEESGFSWESAYWPNPSRGARVRFTNLDNAGMHPSVAPSDRELIHPALIDVIKSYLRYRHTLKPHGNLARELQAFRALDKALTEDMDVPDVTDVQFRHFQRAAELVEHMSGRQAILASLLQILALLSEKLIVPAEVIRWQHPYVKEKSYDNVRGSNAPADVKIAKVADQDAFFSIADIFSKPLSQLDDSDIMVTSITALLLSAPMRIGESLRWRTDCLRTDADKNGDPQRYLAYYVPKTRSYTRKGVPTTIAEVAREAIERLISITEEGRRLAVYMETSPKHFYRHSTCPDVPDDQELTRDQVAQALGFMHRKACEDFMRKHTGNYSLTGFTLDSLWEIVLAEHRENNPHFPYQERAQEDLKPLKMSESLMCFRRLQLGARVSTSPVLLAPFNPDFYRKRLDGVVKLDRKNQRPLCFFTKHGFNPLRLNSHSLRHFINRLAKQYGMSIDELTEWSSRASVRQTRTYLHETHDQKLERSSLIMSTKQEHQTLAPVTEEEATSYGYGPFHRSRYGICRRSWRAGPCNKFADCTNCSELLACKGDKIALAAIKGDRDNMVRTFEAARVAIQNGERSASLWMQKATPQIQRLDELVGIMENPDIPDGTPIALTGTDFNHESLIVQDQAAKAGVELLDREKLALEFGGDLIECLKMLV